MFLDVREPDEYDQGAIPGAVHLPRGNLEFQVEGRLPDKNAPVVVYCAGGVRSAFAAQTMGSSATPTSCRWSAGSTGGRTRVGRGRRPRRSPPTSATATSATSSSPRSARPAS